MRIDIPYLVVKMFKNISPDSVLEILEFFYYLQFKFGIINFFIWFFGRIEDTKRYFEINLSLSKAEFYLYHSTKILVVLDQICINTCNPPLTLLLEE